MHGFKITDDIYNIYVNRPYLWRALAALGNITALNMTPVADRCEGRALRGVRVPDSIGVRSNLEAVSTGRKG